MAVKVEKFNMDGMQEDFFADTAMVGIVCSWPAYHLCWELNNHLGVDFRCVPEMTLPFHENGVTSYFAVYQYLMPDNLHEYLLYKVKNNTTFLLPRQKKGNWLNNIDYLFLLKTATPQADAAAFSARLSKLSGISLALTVESDKIKNLENLLV